MRPFWKDLGESPLHLAVQNDDLDAVQKLKEEKDNKNLLGFTPIEIAQYLGKKRSLEILQPQIPRVIKVQDKSGNKHLFTEREYENFFDVQYTPQLIFPDYDTFKNVINSCPWILEKSSLGEDYRYLATCYAKELETGFVPDVTITWIDDELEYGVITNKSFPPGEYVGEYSGLVHKISRFHPIYNEYCFRYPRMWWSWNYFVIDSEKYGSEMRFLNHSDDPNLDMQLLIERGLIHVCFFAKKFIPKGSQLTFNYGPDFWKDL